MDAKAVYMELANKGIIDGGDQEQISATYGPVQSNQKLHFCLKTKCTKDALKTVCDVMIGVKGNPKMTALGEDIKRTLDKSVCVCVHVCMHMYFVRTCSRVHGYTCVCVFVCVYMCGP